MFFANRRRKETEAQSAEQAQLENQAAEQLRLGKILYETLRPLAEQNTRVCGGKISAGYLERNAGRYSVIISFKDGTFRDTMMQFDIDLESNKLSTGWKYQDGPTFGADEFDLFVETASAMVRDFK